MQNLIFVGALVFVLGCMVFGWDSRLLAYGADAIRDAVARRRSRRDTTAESR